MPSSTHQVSLLDQLSEQRFDRVDHLSDVGVDGDGACKMQLGVRNRCITWSFMNRYFISISLSLQNFVGSIPLIK